MRAIKIELELFDFHIMRASVIEKFFRNIEDRVSRRIVRANWPGKRRNAKRYGAVLSLPRYRVPVDRCLNDLRAFAAEADLCAKQKNTIHSAFGFAE